MKPEPSICDSEPDGSPDTQQPRPGAESPTESARPASDHVLSFDVEEYFQVEAAARSVRPQDWQGYQPRADESVGRILDILAERGTPATFFVLGWVARRDAELVKTIASAGHEIASHGMSHQMITRLSREQFAAELADSKKLLEDLSGSAVLGFRAPTFSILRQTAWAIDALVEAGYEYDSSVYPVRHDRYGVPDAPRWAHWAVGPAGGRILEVPPLTTRTLGMNLPVGGGGYLRLLPARLIGRALASARRDEKTGVIYLHPWELDPDQPVLPMSRMGRWRHRVNLHKTADKLRWLIGRHRFGSFRGHMRTLREAAAEEFAYGSEA